MKHTRQLVAKQSREFINEEKVKTRLLQMHRWDILRGKRLEALEGAEEVRQNSRKLRRFTQYVSTYLVLCEVYRVFRESCEQYKEHQKRKSSVDRIGKNYRNIALKQGKTLAYRDK